MVCGTGVVGTRECETYVRLDSSTGTGVYGFVT